MERTSLYRTIAPLLDNDAILLSDANHGRAKTAKLTRSGARLVQDALPHWQSAQQHVISQLGSDEWSRLSRTILEIPDLLSATKESSG